MNVTEILIAALKDPAPATRVETLRVVALVEETAALSTMRALAGTETDPTVLNTLRWAGDLVARAARNGYSTQSALTAYYRIGQQTTEDQRKEADVIRRMEHQLDMDLIRMRNQAAIVQNVGRGLMFGALGVMAGPNIHSTLEGAGGSAASLLNVADPRLDIGNQPILPPRPTDSNIAVWVRQLRSTEPKTQRQAAAELLGFNNPAALPHLGYCFALAADEPVRMEAQRVGKILYFNWFYWAPKL